MSLASRERAALCDLFDQVGPDAPTLCEGWDTRDLAAHLHLRETSPLAVGILLSPLAGAMERRQREMASGDPYKHARLTGREHEVVKQIAHGATYREIAEMLGKRFKAACRRFGLAPERYQQGLDQNQFEKPGQHQLGLDL